MGYSPVQKGYRRYYPTLRCYFVSTDLLSLRLSRFPFLRMFLVGRDDDLLVYIIASPAPSTPTLALVHVKPSITQVYSRCHNPPVSSPTPATLSLDPIQNDDLPIAFRKGKRQCVHSISSFVSYNHLSSSSDSFIASLDSISLPNTIREALSHPGWRSAMADEMQALDDNGTWDLMPLPIGKKAIGCRWVFAVKFNPNGSVARLLLLRAMLRLIALIILILFLL